MSHSHFSQNFNEQGVGKMREAVARIIAAREKLRRELSQSSLIELVFASSTNFLLVRMRDDRASQQSIHKLVFHSARERGIVLRDRSGEPGLERCLRITVGTPEENQKVLDVFKAVAGLAAQRPEMSV
jgi:histidinol-phosphate aminotransferase